MSDRCHSRSFLRSVRAARLVNRYARTLQSRRRLEASLLRQRGAPNASAISTSPSAPPSVRSKAPASSTHHCRAIKGPSRRGVFVSFVSRLAAERHQFRGVHSRTRQAWTRWLLGTHRQYRSAAVAGLRARTAWSATLQGGFYSTRPLKQPSCHGFVGHRCADWPVLRQSWLKVEVAARQKRNVTREVGSRESGLGQQDGGDRAHAAQRRHATPKISCGSLGSSISRAKWPSSTCAKTCIDPRPFRRPGWHCTAFISTSLAGNDVAGHIARPWRRGSRYDGSASLINDEDIQACRTSGVNDQCRRIGYEAAMRTGRRVGIRHRG